MSEYQPPKLREEVSPQDFAVGLETAPVTIVEYGDYQCPNCAMFHDIIRQILREYGTSVRYVYRHFPMTSIHPQARRAAEAVEAAAEQGQFWTMHNLLYENQRDLSDESLVSYAERLDLDMDKFIEDFNSGRYKERIDQDIEAGLRSGVNGTPTLFVNDIRYDGAWDINSIREFIKRPVGLKIQLLAQRFTKLAVSGGILLFLFTIVALIWANSALSSEYFQLWKSDFVLQIGTFELNKPFYKVINDGLMAVFFFVVGLEIKRELLVGELSDLRKTLLPIFAAVGGMVVPAALYLAFNIGNEDGIRGWGIPMATDIAFMLVIFTFLDKRIPNSLRILFSALAIVDDIGAILIISIFYTDELVLNYLLLAGIVFIVLIIMNRIRIYTILPYLLFGLVLWYGFLLSGVHATVAGVLLAFTIPMREPPNTDALIAQCTNLSQPVGLSEKEAESRQHDVIQTMETITERLQSPAQRLEHDVQPWTTYLILPIFALANAGIALEGYSVSVLNNPITIGIIVGLVLGKPLGIVFFSWIAVKTDIAQLPSQVDWRSLFSVSWLAGIGFTMSIFIAGIAYEDPVLIDEAKIGILIASTLATVIGLTLGSLLTPPIGKKKSSI